jgi:RNA polymerase sigma-70 factor (ECF subfamily)
MFTRKSDEHLIASAIAGSESAWLSLVKRYEKRLYNHALRMVGNKEDALDMLQDVLMSIYRNLASFRGDAPFAAWAFRIATFRCTDHLRRKRPQLTEFEEIPDPLDRGNPERNLQSTESNTDIVNLMATLPTDQRQVIELKFFQNFTFDEIAGQLGISSNTAKSRLYAALKKMRGSSDVQAIAC